MVKSYEPWKGWIVFTRGGLSRMTKLEPALASGEYAIEVHLNVPREFFARPVPRAIVDIPTDIKLQPKLRVDWQGDALAGADPETGVER